MDTLMSNRRLYKAVANEIKAMIASGAYPPGSRLPGERDLAERFGVSRVVIREAEIALETLGFVEIKVGSGAYVTEPETMVDPPLVKASAFELTQLRLLFEPECAALAAMSLRDDEIAKLDATVEQMIEHGDDLELAEAADREFHFLIARLTGNALIEHFISQIWNIRTDVDEVRNVYHSVCERDSHVRVDEHSQILDAIRRRDPEGARRAMRHHFTRLLESLLEQSEREAIEEAKQRTRANRNRFLGSVG